MKKSNITKMMTAGVLAVCVASPVAGKGKPDSVASGDCDQRVPANYCDDELGYLCEAIEGTSSLRPRTVESMVSKVNGASLKINQYKYDEAATKLQAIEDTLTAYHTAAKQKITEVDYDNVSSQLTPAQMCVDGLY
jgi:hypothetical protein